LKKTTGRSVLLNNTLLIAEIWASQLFRKKVKVLVKMGWITATPAGKPGGKEISHSGTRV
jgi:hypothetical protein